MPRRYGQRREPTSTPPAEKVDLNQLFALHQLGAVARQIRLARGMTLRDLDKATGISAPYLSQLERGDRRPSTEAIDAWFAGLGYDVSLLVRRRDS